MTATATKTKRFFKSTITIEVLSEDCSVENMGLADIIEEAATGDLSMHTTVAISTELTGAEAAAALKAQGSDPSFFQLNDDGSPIED